MSETTSAIIKFINGPNNTRTYMSGMLGYITDPAKTDGGSLVSSQGCSRENPLADILMNKKLHQQTHGKQGVHFVLSCPPNGITKTPLDLLKVTREVVRAVYPDFLAVIAVHTDSKVVHSHVVLDAVNAVTGRKFSQGPGDLNRVKQKANNILKAHGFEIIRMSANDFVDYTDYSSDERFDYLELDESVLITETDMQAVSIESDGVCRLDYSVKGGIEWNFPVPSTTYTGGYHLMNEHTSQQLPEETGLTLTEQAVPTAAAPSYYPTTTVVTGPTFHIRGSYRSDFSGLEDLVSSTVSQAQEHEREAASLALAMQTKAQESGHPTNVAVIAGPVFDIELTNNYRVYRDDGDDVDNGLYD